MPAVMSVEVIGTDSTGEGAVRVRRCPAPTARTTDSTSISLRALVCIENQISSLPPNLIFLFFIFGFAGSLLLRGLYSSCREQVPLSRCGVPALEHRLDSGTRT